MIATLFKIFLIYIAFLVIRAVIKVSLFVWRVRRGIIQMPQQSGFKSYSYTFGRGGGFSSMSGMGARTGQQAASEPGPQAQATPKPVDGNTFEADYKVIN